MNCFHKKQKNVLPIEAKHRSHFHWWQIPITFVLLIIIGISGIFAYANSNIYKNVKYVNTWAEAVSAASDSGSSSSASFDPTSSSAFAVDAQTGLASLDAGDFLKVQQKDYPIIKVKQKDPEIENILIMGIDGGDPGGVGQNRADSMIVASINTRDNTLKLSSLMRDTKTYFPNTDDWHKLNAAYSYGGPGLQIDVINYAYKLDIQKYILFDFDGFSKIVDLLGGVPITLTAEEASYSYINAGTAAGTYNLNGTQALGYARTRYIDSDFLRTQRQRNIMISLYQKFKNASMPHKIQTAEQCLDLVQTNISTTEVLGKLLTFESTMNSDIKQIEIPTEDDGMYTTETSPIWYWDLNWDQEVPKLQNFIYGN